MQRKNRYQDIQLSQLRSFCLAALEGNFTTVAKGLGLSAATVWEQVRALERRLKTVLLRRHGHVVELTAEGRVLLELIQPCVGTIDSLDRLFEAQRAEMPQLVTVLSTNYLVSHHLVRPVQEFTTANPGVRLSLLADPWAIQMLQRVERGDAQLGVVDYSMEEPRHPFMDYEDLFELELTLLTASNHPLARKKRLSVTDLVDYPMIRPPKGNYSRKALDRLLQHHGLDDRIHVVLENNTVDIIRKYVAAGTGIALVYLGGEQGERVPGVQQRVFDAEPDRLSVAIVSRKGSCFSEPAEEFRRVLLAVACHTRIAGHATSSGSFFPIPTETDRVNSGIAAV